jgi:hypothetical protein
MFSKNINTCVCFWKPLHFVGYRGKNSHVNNDNLGTINNGAKNSHVNNDNLGTINNGAKNSHVNNDNLGTINNGAKKSLKANKETKPCLLQITCYHLLLHKQKYYDKIFTAFVESVHIMTV